MTIRERLYTAGDLWALSHLPQNAGKRLELSEGELIEMPPAGGEHGGVALNISHPVWAFVRQHDLGYVTAAETGYILYKNPDGWDTVRAPDVGFVRRARLPDGLPPGYIPFAPDLVVEVVSLNDPADEIQRRVSEYLRYGPTLVWVAYPRTRSVVVHTPEKAVTVDIEGTLDGADVLPGFALPVREIFR
jgi:Uma2 family endonuclease